MNTLDLLKKHLTIPEIAELCGNISVQAVYKWAKSGNGIPFKHCITLERATGIPRAYLNPKIYGEPKKRSA